jgi:hypothetical protein
VPAIKHEFGIAGGHGALTMSLFLAGYAVFIFSAIQAKERHPRAQRTAHIYDATFRDIKIQVPDPSALVISRLAPIIAARSCIPWMPK